MKYFYDCEFLEGTQKKKFWWGNTVPTIDLISIGIVSEEGREYYAVSKDFNLKEVWNRFDVQEQTPYEKQHGFSGRKIYWIRENVLRPIFNELLTRFNNDSKDSLKNKNYIGCIINQKFSLKLLKFLVKYYGKTNKQIAQEVKNFCYYDKETRDGGGQFVSGSFIPNKYPNIELYGYYSAYDHVALCWLFGKMIDLPSGFPMYTIDLKQELDRAVINKEKEYFRKLECDICTHNVLEYLERTGEALELDFRLKLIKEKDKNYPKQTNEHNSLSDAKFNFELYKFLKQ